MRLYDYWRSSAAYRVRIALNFKGLAYEQVAVDLRAGAQRAPEFLALNPQGLVPVLEDDGAVLTQSLPILNYLEERYPEPALLPKDAPGRARSRAIAVAIACEIHPLNNLRVLQYLERELGLDEARRLAWYRHWIAEGLGPIEAMLAGAPASSASAMRRASPTSAWCRRSTTPAATTAIWRPIRRSAGSTSAAGRSTPSPAPRPSASPTPVS